ncbi:MAG: flagellar biosynthesis protein FlhA [Armatimonadota bacterium]|nr:flagellar biosynthesis protein FlhA [Armatimonadota bacterium]
MRVSGSILRRALGHSDVMMAIGIIGLVAMMLIPLPPALLDMLLTVNFGVALCILLVSMYVREPLEFAVFPSVLLVATLFRLALNISSTRLILLHAHAGKVIEAFGGFVVGGDLVVGLILFLILVIIQFVVITSGSQRVAEVAARFTLDEMPGKQMSIDADLNAGLITEEEARQRRRTIEREADFYGAMDGATKFVRGDAIAAIVIVVINIIAGLIIGVARLGLEPGEALRRYALLTVGDGLVSQIPALLISTATGLVVTRAASDRDLGSDVVTQLLSQPRAVAIVAVMLVLFGMVPGLPTLSFFAIGGVTGLVAWYVGRHPVTPSEEPEDEDAAELDEQRPVAVPAPERLAVSIGYGLIPLVEEGQSGRLLARIGTIREQIAEELGLLVPPVRIQDDMSLDPRSYAVRLRGATIATGSLQPSAVMAIAARDGLDKLPGTPVTEPAFGLPAWWIEPDQRTLAEARGYTVVEPDVVLATHLSELIKSHAPELLCRQDVQVMLDDLRQTNAAAVNELIPDLASVGQLHQVLAALLEEGVPITDLSTIVEALADALRGGVAVVGRGATAAEGGAGLEDAVEHVRAALARTICEQYRDEDGALAVYVLDPELEAQIAEAVVDTPQGPTCLLDPAVLQRLLEAVQDAVEELAAQGRRPIVLTSPPVRRHLRELIWRSFPDMAVISHAEVVPDVQLRALGSIRLEAVAA